MPDPVNGTQPFLYNALADAISRHEATANQGRGIECVRWLTGLLRQGNWDGAVHHTRSEWDKLSSYPEIKQLVIEAGLFTPINFDTFARTED